VIAAGRGRRAARLAALLLLTVLAAVALSRLSLTRLLAELAVAQPQWIVLALVCYLAILPLWALQWCLLAPVSPRPVFSRMLGVVAMTSTVLNTTPLLVGEAAGILFLVAVTGLARAAALSVLAMDQLLVGLAKVVVVGVAASTATLPGWMERGAEALLGGVSALFLGLLLVAWRSDHLARLASRLLPARAARLLVAVGEALAPLRSPIRGCGALLLALAKKLVEVGAIACIARAFGVELPLSGAILVLAALNLATLLPIVPGNIGVYEAAVVLAYSHLGVSAERALGIAVVQHACYFAALALPGYRWLARGAATRRSAAAA
jgi:uncharacterized membrane protein YbhN (UPF0104 family)